MQKYDEMCSLVNDELGAIMGDLIEQIEQRYMDLNVRFSDFFFFFWFFAFTK